MEGGGRPAMHEKGGRSEGTAKGLRVETRSKRAMSRYQVIKLLCAWRATPT